MIFPIKNTFKNLYKGFFRGRIWLPEGDIGTLSLLSWSQQKATRLDSGQNHPTTSNHIGFDCSNKTKMPPTKQRNKHIYCLSYAYELFMTSSYHSWIPQAKWVSKLFMIFHFGDSWGRFLLEGLIEWNMGSTCPKIIQNLQKLALRWCGGRDSNKSATSFSSGLASRRPKGSSKSPTERLRVATGVVRRSQWILVEVCWPEHVVWCAYNII